MCTLQNTGISAKTCTYEIKEVPLQYQIKNMFNIKPIESMKKTIITLVAVISAIIMCSCGNGTNSEKQELLHMRDSLQQRLDECSMKSAVLRDKLSEETNDSLIHEYYNQHCDLMLQFDEINLDIILIDRQISQMK